MEQKTPATEAAQAGQHDSLDPASHFRSTGALREDEAVADLFGRLEAASCGSALIDMLEPIASFIRAETACVRSMERSPGRRALPRTIAALGVSSSMDDAYRERFHAFDPAKRLPLNSPSGPVFADPALPGQWLGVPIASATKRRLLTDFIVYRRAFLEPGNLVHHTGFFFNDGLGRKLLFDFHRGRRSQSFGRLEIARAHVVAHYLYAGCADKERHLLPRRPSSVEIDAGLSAREFEVAMAVSEGLSNKAVASALKISVRTVENHLRSIFEKLQVGSRTQLTAVLRRSPRSAAHAENSVRDKGTQ